MAMAYGIASEAPAVLDGAAYRRSPRYKSLIPSPEACHLIGDNKISISSLQSYRRSAEYVDGDFFLSHSTAFIDCN